MTGGGGGRPSVTRNALKKYFICIISYYNLYYCVCFINRFSICRADRRALRYGGGGGRPSVTLCDGGGGSAERYA